MHIVEILMYVGGIGLLVCTVKRKSMKIIPLILLCGMMMVLIIVQLIFIGSRWQVYPFYIAMIFLSSIIFIDKVRHIHLYRFFQNTLVILASFLIAISLVSTLVFPVYELPEPSGKYLIGTESFVIEDESRLELYSEDPNDYRRTKIQMWYPAETVDGYKKAPWIEDGLLVTRALSRDIGLPFFALDHTANIMSNAYVGAPLSNAQDDYPVVILSHGWRGFKNLHTDYAEELASLGYIVIGIDHAYGSVATVYGDNDVAYLNPDALPERDSTSDFIEYANQLVHTYGSDISVTLDYLEDMNNTNSSSKFSNRLDLDNIGLIGHSTGGGADVAVALEDNRIESVIGLDAWVEPIGQDLIENGLSTPSLFIRSETWETGENNDNLITLINQSSDSVLYQIDDTTHYDFAMVYMYSPLTRYIGFSGDIDVRYLVSVLKEMISEFFDATLKKDANAQIDIDEWDEVREITTD